MALYRCVKPGCRWNTANKPTEPCPDCGGTEFNVKDGDKRYSMTLRPRAKHTFTTTSWRYWRRAVIVVGIAAGVLLALAMVWSGCFNRAAASTTTWIDHRLEAPKNW